MKFNSKFGIEIEFTGITRTEASKVVQSIVGGSIIKVGDYYDSRKVIAQDGRSWEVMYDGSLKCEKIDQGGYKVPAPTIYSCELVCPILS